MKKYGVPFDPEFRNYMDQVNWDEIMRLGKTIDMMLKSKYRCLVWHNGTEFENPFFNRWYSDEEIKDNILDYYFEEK